MWCLVLKVQVLATVLSLMVCGVTCIYIIVFPCIYMSINVFVMLLIFDIAHGCFSYFNILVKGIGTKSN